jgi:hypothetical protein
MTQANEAAAPKPGSPEYNAMMVARADAGTGQPSGDGTDPAVSTSIPTMPEGGFEKFYDKKTGAYNWQAHAKEAEFKLAQKGGKKPDGQAAKPNQLELGTEAGDQAAADIVAKAGLDINELGSQIRTAGDISDEAKAKLVEQGIPAELIEDYVSLAKYRIENETASALTYIGGEDEWKALNEWATANLSKAEQATYNEMLQGEGWKVAIDTLKAKRAAAKPGAKEGNLRTGNVNASSSATGYASKAEMTRDIQDPKYKTDPAFRRMVAQRIAVSTYTE